MEPQRKELWEAWGGFCGGMVGAEAGWLWKSQIVISCVRCARELGLDLPGNGKPLPKSHRGIHSCPPSKSV